MIILISISFCKRKLTKKYLLWHTFFISSIEIRRCFLTPFDVLSECRLMYRQCARQLCTTYNFFFKVCRSRIPTTNLSWEVWPFSTSVIFRAAELLCRLVDHQSTHSTSHLTISWFMLNEKFKRIASIFLAYENSKY